MSNWSCFACAVKNIGYKLSVAEPMGVVDPRVPISPMIFREMGEGKGDGGRGVSMGLVGRMMAPPCSQPPSSPSDHEMLLWTRERREGARGEHVDTGKEEGEGG